MTPVNDYLEIIRPLTPGSQIRLAVFDFDGTLSLIRQGWQKVMASMMVETLLAATSAGDRARLAAFAADLIHRTTGQPTLQQMAALAGEIRARGGRAEPAEVYKRQYLQRLEVMIVERLAALAGGRITADALMVPGARAIVDGLTARGVICALASGTDYLAVCREATVLGLAPLFEDRIYGPTDDQPFSKGEVIARLQQAYDLTGAELAVFGDGVIEIEEAGRAGAVTIGVASDEASRQGINQEKRAHLIAAGAQMIVPDFSQADRLIHYLCGSDNELSHL